ncbi:MAG TPA: S8 family serine peptidase [Marmoricola sp.]|nr:S8 family serine peptidase [Marmoricola sp.]
MTNNSRSSRAVAVAATVAVVAGLAAIGGAATAASGSASHGTSGISVTKSNLTKAVAARHSLPRALKQKPATPEPGSALPAGVPSSGRYAFLIKLNAQDTGQAYAGALAQGKGAASSAAKGQLSHIVTAQNKAVDELPSGSKVLYRMHSVLAGIAVTTDVKNYGKLQAMSGVTGVYPIAPKSTTNSYAVPLQGAPTAWEAHGDLGANSTVAIIDTGVDYTHADFGGEGTKAAYDAAKADLGADPNDFPGQKVVGGYDFAGDDYNADPTDPAYNPTPSPDAYPLDCNSHGSHVAGTVAGYGENADGTTYTGDYNTSTPFDQMKIGPGMAPRAKLYAYRVFGCEGSSDLISEAIDRAADPNGDGDPSDHVDVINMSLGSDYGSPQDGDSVTTEAATAAGILVVVASGNAGDLYDVGGSPGNTPSALTAAASRDAYAQVDALNVTAPASIADSYAAERSIAYDWADDPDLSGDVVRLTDPTNLDGCDTLSAADKAAVTDKIAFVEWTDTDADRRCGSAVRGDNLAAAGATGFIYADDEEQFAAGITGSVHIPGVLLAKSGGDKIRTELEAGHTVTIGSTTANGKSTLDTSLNDTLASFSSRGIGDAGDVKPDITAVGDSVFSAGSGTGNEGLNDSGTSMATPMTAGAAALVRSQHPEWTPEQAKADLMNTAGADLYTGTSKTGDTYAPQRVGAGRLEVDQALDNDVLAYNAQDKNAVSVSFGPQAVSAPTTLTKTIKVQNTGLSSATYDVAYDSRTSVPGATYTVTPSSVALDPRSSATVTVTLALDPSQMTKTIDPTVDADQGGLPRQFQSDTSGLVVLTPSGSGPDLRVPVYAAPRPASVMTQASSLTLPGGDVQVAQLPLTGQAVNQGSGAEKIQAAVAGFELQATSGKVPGCSTTVTSGCVSFPDERAADLAEVGTTSSAPELASDGEDPMDGEAYFAINAQGRWRTPATFQEYDIYIDGDGDGVADAVLFNTRLPSTDVMVAELVDLSNGDVLDAEGINDTLGDTDTAMFDSDTIVLPTLIGAIPGVTSASSRITYAVQAFSPYQGDPVDQIGNVDGDGTITDGLTTDVLHPGVALYGTYTGDASPLLYPDGPSSVLNLRRDAAAYATDGGQGAMIVHFHNTIGNKAQVLSLKTAPAVTLALSPNPVARGGKVTATVSVPGAGTPATGAVVIKAGSATLASGTVAGGSATLSFSLAKAGAYSVVAQYAGDDQHLGGSSTPVALTVAKTAPSVSIAVSPNPVKKGKKVSAVGRIAPVAGVPAAGSVILRRLNGTVLARGTVTNGFVLLTYTNKYRAKYTMRLVYSGDANYLTGTSAAIVVRIKK